jgi:biopolymer transport protein ExbD
VPNPNPPPPNLIKPTINKVTITREGQVMWNGTPQTGSQLVTDLKTTLTMNPEPELQFQPDQDASYDLSAKVLNIIKGSKVTKFGFVGNEQFAEFGKAPGAK